MNLRVYHLFFFIVAFSLSAAVFAADRYWVGGTNNWNNTAGTKWATCSGCAGGAAVPTSADDVYFDGASGAVTVTLSSNRSARSVNFTGFTGTFAGTSTLSVYGDLILDNTMNLTFTGPVNFLATAGPFSITSDGETFASVITFNGAGGTWQLADHFSSNTLVTLTEGTFSANGFNFTAARFSSDNNNVRTLTFGAGTWTLTGNNATIWTTAVSTNMTVNRGNPVQFNYAGGTGTRTIIGSAAEAASVDFDITAGTDIVDLTGGVHDIDFTGFAGTVNNDARTIYGNLTLEGAAVYTAGVGVTTFSGTTGPYTITSDAETVDFPITFDGVGGEWQLLDNLTIGSTRTVTLTNGTLNANGRNFVMGRFASSNANNRVITMGAGTWTLTGNNATIWTTSTSTNLTINYGNPVVSNYAGATGTRIVIGSASEGAAPDFNFTGGTDIIDLTGGARHVNFTGFAGTVNNDARTIYGNLTLEGAAVYTAGVGVTTFSGTTGPYTITSDAETVDFPITFDGVGGTWRLSDNLTVGSTRTVTLTNGTLDANGFNFLMGLFSSSNANNRVITFGSGTWTLTGNNATIWTTATSTNLTVNRGNPVVASYSGATGTRTITGGSEAAAVDFNISAGTDIVALNSGARTVNFTGFAGTLSNLTRTVYGGIVFSAGMTLSAGVNVTTFGATSSTYSITSNGKTLDFPITFDGVGGTWQLGDNVTVGATRTVTLTNGTLDANGFNFSMGLFSSSNANNRVITMGSGTWNITATSTSTVWNTATVTNLTINPDSATINLSGVTANTRTVSAGGITLPHLRISAGTGGITTTNVDCNDLNFTGYSGAWGSANITVRGHLTFSAGMTITAGANTITMAATTGPKSITSSGKTVDRILTFNGAGGTWQLADALTVGSSRLVTLAEGTLDANGNDFSMGSFDSSNANNRVITMGAGTWTLTGNNTTIWTTGTSTNLTLNRGNAIQSTYAGAVGTRTVIGSLSEVTAPDFDFTAGTDIIDLTGGSRHIDFTGFAGTLNLDTRTIYGDLTLAAGMTISAGSNITTFSGTAGTYNIRSNGRTMGFPITFDGVGGTWQLSDALTLSSTGTLILTNGAFDANDQSVDIAAFESSNSNTRTLSMGTGNWTLTSSGTIWDTSTSTNLTLNAETSTIIANNASSSARVLTGNSVDINHLNITAGSGTVTLTNMDVNDINWTGFSGTWSNDTISIRGSATLAAAMTAVSGANVTTFTSTSGFQTVNTNGVQYNRPIVFDGVGGNWRLLGDLDMSGATARTLTLTNGTFDANGFNVTAANFSSSNANNRVIAMGEGTWTLNGSGTVWDLTTTTNLTLNCESSVLALSDVSATSKTFVGGNQTYSTFRITGSGTFDFTGSNTFGGFDVTTQPNTLRFTAGTTTTFNSAPDWSGTAGNLNVLKSMTSAQNILNYGGAGTLNYQYLDINYSRALPVSTWYCDGSCINSGNNWGWNFPSVFVSPKPLVF